MNMKLIKNTENISKEKITLFCLPFAGGGASAYNQWAKKMQGKVTVCPVQLPGREEQIMEKPYIDMSVMLDDLEEAVRKVVYGPYALWGHSMGGKIAYELEKRLEAAGYTAKGVFGELLSRGPYTIDGYYMAEEANKKSFTPDGFYRTGDKAMWTKDGRLRLGGRIKEQINRAGEKIMPSEIEAYLCRHSKIKEAAVVGVPDETLGNRICAFLVTDDEAGIDLQEIHRFLREIGVAAYKMPDQIEWVETWPLTSVGKIDKKALERMAQEK